jgi:hypothetical protein
MDTDAGFSLMHQLMDLFQKELPCCCWNNCSLGVFFEPKSTALSTSRPKTQTSFIRVIYKLNKKKLDSVALVRKRTTPTERPLLVGEVSANLCG